MKTFMKRTACSLGLLATVGSNAFATPAWTGFVALMNDSSPNPFSAQLVVQVPINQPDAENQTFGPFFGGTGQVSSSFPLNSGAALVLYDSTAGAVTDIFAGANIVPDND